jgi:hypothetical protein
MGFLVGRILAIRLQKEKELKEIKEKLASALLEAATSQAEIIRREKELELIIQKHTESHAHEDAVLIEEIHQERQESLAQGVTSQWAGGSSEIDAFGEISEEAFQQVLVDLFGDIPV